MSIKKSQAILKRFIDLNYSDWFTLDSEDETNCFVTLSPIFSLNFTNRNNPARPNYDMSMKKSQAKCTENIGSPVI